MIKKTTLKVRDKVRSLITKKIGEIIDIDQNREYADYVWITTGNAKYKVGLFVIVEYNYNTHKDWQYENMLDLVKTKESEFNV